MCRNNQKTNETKDNYYLAGIGSWGILGYISVFTDISQFVSWIDKTSTSELVIFLTLNKYQMYAHAICSTNFFWLTKS